VRSAYYETACRVDVVLGLRIHHAGRNNRVDDVLLDFLAKFLDGNIGAVLRGDDHGLDTLGLAIDVLHRDLALAVGAEKFQDALAARYGEAVHQFVGHHDGEWHQLGGFVAGKTEHHALVAGAARVHAHRNVGRLRLDQVVHAAGVGIEPIGGVVVADVVDGAARDALNVHVGLGGDFAGHNASAGGDQHFARHAAGGIVRQDRVQNGV